MVNKDLNMEKKELGILSEGVMGEMFREKVNYVV